MTPLVPLTMFGWIPVVIGLFAKLRPHHAAIAGFLLAWMFLPQYDYELPGLPNYSKIAAASYGILLGTLLFARNAFSLIRFHPLDLPVTLWCVSSFFSSISNGLGVWDGLSALLGKVTLWGIPYLVGRLHFHSTKALRDLCVGIFLGALLYVPFCLYELVMSPRLHKMVYGWHPAQFGQSKRGGGWRPVVFMKHGLMTAMWMGSGCLAGLRLLPGGFRRGRLPILPLRAGLAVFAVVVTFVLCKSLGATLLVALGLAVILVASRQRRVWPIALIIVYPLLYVSTRGSGVWDAQQLVRVAHTHTSPERAGSLEFRILNEDILARRARERLLLGWAGWKRSWVRNESGETVSVPDGLWIIAFGQNGVFGLACLTLTLLVPQILFMRRFPVSSWRDPQVAALVPLSVLLGLFMIDNLLNDMFNPVMLLSAGGLTGLYVQTSVEADGDSVPVQPASPPDTQEGPRLL